jgi:hypothetical protein
MDQRRTPAPDARKAEPAGAPEPRAVPTSDRARTEDAIAETLPRDQRSRTTRKA